MTNNLKFTGKHSVAVSSQDLNIPSKENKQESIRKEQPANIKVYNQEKTSKKPRENISQADTPANNAKETDQIIKESEQLADKVIKMDSHWHKWIWPEWLKILNHPARIKVCITDRNTGKSKNTGLFLLFKVLTEEQFLATVIMRNYDESLEITRPQYHSYINTLINLITPENKRGEELNKWKIKEADKWDSYGFAVMYSKDGKQKPQERIFFITIHDAEKSKKSDDPHQQIFLEECVPTKNQLKKGKGIEGDEPNNYSTIYDSVRRGTKPQQNFLGNPNMPWLDLWFIVLHWHDETQIISDWYWKNSPSKWKENLKAWREWTWSIKDIIDSGAKFPAGVKYNAEYNCLEKEIEEFGLAMLYLKKSVHEQKPWPTDEDWNWHAFFTLEEKLKYTDFINGSRPVCVFQDCILYQSKRGFLFFCHKDYPHRSNIEDDEFIKLFYVNEEQRILNPDHRTKWRVDKEKLRNEWAWRFDTGKLYFCKDGMSREIIMRFIGRGILPHQL